MVKGRDLEESFCGLQQLLTGIDPTRSWVLRTKLKWGFGVEAGRFSIAASETTAASIAPGATPHEQAVLLK